LGRSRKQTAPTRPARGSFCTPTSRAPPTTSTRPARSSQQVQLFRRRHQPPGGDQGLALGPGCARHVRAADPLRGARPQVILFMMACALRSSPSQSLSIEGGNLLPPAMKPPKGVSSRRDRVAKVLLALHRRALAQALHRRLAALVHGLHRPRQARLPGSPCARRASSSLGSSPRRRLRACASPRRCYVMLCYGAPSTHPPAL
jgi:hypothetical protein